MAAPLDGVDGPDPAARFLALLLAMAMMVAAAPHASFALLTRQSAGTAADDLPLVVALHDRGGDAEQAIRYARMVLGAQPSLLAPQAARPCNPLLSNYRGASAYAGYAWYLGSEAERPEPASFGDALAQLEALLERLPPLVLLGQGQGAALALALAAHDIGEVAAVIVDRCVVPRIPGWQLPSLQHRRLALLALDGSGNDEEDAGLSSLGFQCGAAAGGAAMAWLRAATPVNGA
ncbi:MAG TPA: hypothetical protein VEC57_18670 [Candidatus Limnocylindrales bacterium]|nr:hypothetical protein [Candidatus Limnocylindrales bacterium]